MVQYVNLVGRDAPQQEHWVAVVDICVLSVHKAHRAYITQSELDERDRISGIGLEQCNSLTAIRVQFYLLYSQDGWLVPREVRRCDDEKVQGECAVYVSGEQDSRAYLLTTHDSVVSIRCDVHRLKFKADIVGETIKPVLLVAHDLLLCFAELNLADQDGKEQHQPHIDFCEGFDRFHCRLQLRVPAQTFQRQRG